MTNPIHVSSKKLTSRRKSNLEGERRYKQPMVVDLIPGGLVSYLMQRTEFPSYRHSKKRLISYLYNQECRRVS